MKPFVTRLLATVNRFRPALLLTTFIVACVLYYVMTKSMAGRSLHALLGLFVDGDIATIRGVRAGSLPMPSPRLRYLELGLDVLLIPLYTLSLLVCGAYLAPAPISTPALAQHWYTHLLNWLAPWLPVVLFSTAITDLLEAGGLACWSITKSVPLFLATIHDLKFATLFTVITYVSLRLVTWPPIVLFIGDLSGNLWTIFKAITLNKYIRCGVAMLRTVWPVCLVLIITYLFLNIMDQARDLLYSLVHDLSYSISVFAFLLLFAVTIWYSTRIIFILKDQRHLIERVSETETAEYKQELTDFLTKREEINKWLTNLPNYRIIDSQTLRAFTRWTPVVLGLVPFFVLMTALGKIEQVTRHQFALAVEMVVYAGIAYRVKNYVAGLDGDDCNIHPHFVRDLLPVHKRALRTALTAGLFLVVLASKGETNLIISRALGPIAIVFLGLTMWIMIASFFTYLDYRYKAPFTLICLLIMMFMDNNNHQIRTIGYQEARSSYFSKDTANKTIPAYFDAWLTQLIKDRKKENYGNGPIPVYLISTEGGGIRSAYWTATALKQLDSAQSHFFRHVFAISGVSGGSVGATLFTAQYRDKLLAGQKNKYTTFSFDIDKFFARDYLSPLLTAMLIPDMLQKFSPVSINSVDRAQYLEDGWADAYMNDDIQRITGPDSTRLPQAQTLDKPFLDLWADPSTRYRVPVLFLNATQVETGRKGLLTPLVIQNDPHFANVIDIQESVYRHIPLKTAASISARFPFVTPPATIQVVNEPAVDASNFVDGGYLDNSGTTTLMSILSSITSNRKPQDTLMNRVVFHIISMNNSVETDPNQQVKSLAGLYELKAPLLAFFGAWDNSGDYHHYAVKEYVRGFGGLGKGSGTTGKQSISFQQHSINLNRRVGVIPLGWDLSDQAVDHIKEQARKLYAEFSNQSGAYADMLVGLPPRSAGPLHQSDSTRTAAILFSKK